MQIAPVILEELMTKPAYDKSFTNASVFLAWQVPVSTSQEREGFFIYPV